MPEDVNNVQADAVVETAPTEVTEPQPFTPEQDAKLQQMLSEASSTAKEAGRREMQGIKDREVATADRKARLAESKSAGYESSFANLDEDTRKDVELAQLKSRDQYYQSRESEETQRQQVAAFDQSFHTNLNQFITSMGVDPNDKGIDWGDDATDYLAKQQRVLSSVAKIQKVNAKVTEDKKTQDFKELEAKLRKDLGLDSVDTSTSAGISKGIPTDMGTFRGWVDSLSQAEYKEKKKDIDEMLLKGLIK